MSKTTTKQPAGAAKRAASGKPENGAKRTPNRKQRHKPFNQMTLEELTLFGFQLAHEQHQRELNGQADASVHA